MIVDRISIHTSKQVDSNKDAFEEVSEFTFPGGENWSSKVLDDLFDHIMLMCNWAYDARLLQLSFALEAALDACILERDIRFSNRIAGPLARSLTRKFILQVKDSHFYSNKDTWEFEIENKPVIIVSM